MPTSLHEKTGVPMTSVDSHFNFLCGRPHGAGPPSPRVHLSLTPLPCGRHKWMDPKTFILLQDTIYFGNASHLQGNICQLLCLDNVTKCNRMSISIIHIC